MAISWKIIIQLWMIAVALGFGPFQPTCAAWQPETRVTCCCTGAPGCPCESRKSPQQLCPVLSATAMDREVSNPLNFASDGLIVLPSPVMLSRSFFPPAPHRQKQEAEDSPPFCGSPPQARLCLWLI